MGEKKIAVDVDVIEKVLLELNEIRDFYPDDMLKLKIRNIVKLLSNASNCNVDEKPFIDEVYDKMKESKTKNPELNTKLYMLYRSLSDGKTSEEDAKYLFEVYLQMYPDDEIIY